MATARLFLSNLTYRTTEENLTTDFEEIGKVLEASIIRDRETKRSKGYGFITVNEMDEDKFLALHDYMYDSRRLVVKRAEKRPTQGGDKPKLYKPNPEEQAEPETGSDAPAASNPEPAQE